MEPQSGLVIPLIFICERILMSEKLKDLELSQSGTFGITSFLQHLTNEYNKCFFFNNPRFSILPESTPDPNFSFNENMISG